MLHLFHFTVWRSRSREVSVIAAKSTLSQEAANTTYPWRMSNEALKTDVAYVRRLRLTAWAATYKRCSEGCDGGGSVQVEFLQSQGFDKWGRSKECIAVFFALLPREPPWDTVFDILVLLPRECGERSGFQSRRGLLDNCGWRPSWPPERHHSRPQPLLLGSLSL
jgi:hypothetical protein